MKKVILYSVVLLLSFSLRAQGDSLIIANAPWQIDSLDGFVLKRMHFVNSECLGSNQYVCILELPFNSPRQLAFTYEPRRTPTTVHAQRHNAFAAVNGSFFDMKYHNPICYLRIDGKELGENTPQATDSVNRKYYQYSFSRQQYYDCRTASHIS